jgi:hypothetical protein
LWNYNPYNDDQKGDDWNGENFSWFSRQRALPSSLLYYEQTAPSLDGGGRILPAVVRPYPAKTAGIPLRFEYEVTTGRFDFEWADPETTSAAASGMPRGSELVSRPPLVGHPPLTSRETEIFVPSRLAHGRKLIVKGLSIGDSHRYDQSRQTLFIVVGDSKPGASHRISVSFDPQPEPIFEVSGFWSDFGMRLVALLVVVLGLIAHRVFA